MDQIVAWRKDQWAHAALLQENRFLPQDVAHFLADPSGVYGENLRSRLRILAKQQDFGDILLVGQDGNVLLGLGETTPLPNGYASAQSTALRQSKPVFTDLCVTTQNPAPHISDVGHYIGLRKIRKQ